MDIIPDWLANGFITLLAALLALFGKEWFDKRRASSQREQAVMDAAKVYADPLLFSLTALVYRLHNIFQGNDRFLTQQSSQNEYHEYLFRSTLYRLCAVLGWLRAVNRELAGMEISNQEAYNRVSQAIKEFEEALVKNPLLAESRLRFLLRLWKIDSEALTGADFSELAATIDRMVWDALHEQNVSFAHELDDGQQKLLLHKMARQITAVAEIETFDPDIVIRKQQSSIQALSRVESWLYRDWQAAIGDMMLVPSRHNERRFEVIGYSRFEDIYLDHLAEDKPDNRWLARAERLFGNLDLSRSEVFDARGRQLRHICSAAVCLVDRLAAVQFGVRKVDPGGWTEALRFDRENNPHFYQELAR